MLRISRRIKQTAFLTVLSSRKGESQMSYIKIDRKILDWEWYRNLNTCRLFFHLLLKANWKDGRFEGKEIPKGSFVSSVARLAEETDMTPREIRTGLDHLKSTGEVTIKSYSKYSVFTVTNYHCYQDCDKQATNSRQTNDKQTTSKRQTNDKRTTTIEEKKEIKEGKNNNNYSVLFERVWKEYPRKKEKSSAYKAYNTRLKEGYSEDDLLKATQNYAAECKKLGTQDRYIKLGRTFFGVNTPFTDYLKVGVENAEPERQTETEQQRREREYLEEYGTGI